MKTTAIGNITIATTMIPTGGRTDRQARERATVRKILQTLLDHDVTIGHTPEGAPIVDGRPDLYISISHSVTRAIVALSTETPVGIDTETLRPQLERVLDRYMTPAEQAEWTTPVDHLVAWCIKEAAYKVAGIPGLDLKDDITIDRTRSQVTVKDTPFNYTITEKIATEATVLVTPV